MSAPQVTGMGKTLRVSDRIILALDVNKLEEALLLALEIEDAVGCFKIGLQMLTHAGPSVFTQFLRKYSRAKFFYDAKFHDIPATVEAACRSSAELPGIEFISVHASMGLEALKRAQEAAHPSKLIAITALTSLGDDECRKTFGVDRRSSVLRFSEWAAEADLAGIMCSPLELKDLKDGPRRSSGEALLKLVPGIRPEWSLLQDQKATATPYQAIMDGADYLVIGRPITEPPVAIGSPLAAVTAIADEISRALKARE